MTKPKHKRPSAARIARRVVRKKNGEKTVAHDEQGRFTGAIPGPGRPLGRLNTTTPLRRMFDATVTRLGGEKFVRQYARRFPKHFLELAVRLEPRLLLADLDVETHDNEPSVRILMPFNFRSTPEALGDAALYLSETETVLRLFEQIGHRQSAGDLGRQRWLAEVIAAVREKIARERSAGASEA
jgi:hypothetical protein